MKILHTSDWHLGQNFMFHDRKREHSLFLDWLLEEIRKERVDLLIIAGDIFDTGTPPNYAEALYFRFLAGVAHLKFCHVVVLGGNHDSVSSLNSSKRLLKLINTHVVASCSENIEDDIIVIRRNTPHPKESQSREETPMADEAQRVGDATRGEDILGIICCVPFLRERDIRSSIAGESYDEKVKALIEGVRRHYDLIYDAAVRKREALIREDHTDGERSYSHLEDGNQEISHHIPIIGTGHLFAAGGTPSDGVRDIYVGNLGHVEVDAMDRGFDYVALGHLHRAQLVGKKEHIRYCGSPIALSFSEANREKQVIIVQFEPLNSTSSKVRIKPVPVPEFQRLRKIEGDLEQIKNIIASLEHQSVPRDMLLLTEEETVVEKSHNTIWLEVKYTGDELVTDLKERVLQLIEGKDVELFSVMDMNGVKRNGELKDKRVAYLDQLKEIDIFRRRLESAKVPEEKIEELFHAFKEIMEQASHPEEDLEKGWG